MEFTVIDTSYEPPSISYGEMFSWQGDLFPKRQNQHDEVTRQKRSSRKKKPPMLTYELNMPKLFTTTSDAPKEGVFVIVENASIIQDYLYGSPRKPFRTNRRPFVIAVTKPDERSFMRKIRKLLRHLWQDYAVADAILITPCNNDPEVSGC